MIGSLYSLPIFTLSSQSKSWSTLLKLISEFFENFLHEYCIYIISTPTLPSPTPLVSLWNPWPLLQSFLLKAHTLCWTCLLLVYMCLGLTNWDRITYQKVHTWKKTDSPSLSSHWLAVALHSEGGLCAIFPIHTGMSWHDWETTLIRSQQYDCFKIFLDALLKISWLMC